jgi:glycosyltransferase involved in cell wall biosynthesis
MKLLIITQKVDNQDDVLGFMHRWIEQFAAQCEQVTVICLFEGRHALPANVRVFSLGKEKGVLRLEYLVRFFGIIWRERAAYDSVFVHMNQVYVLLGGLLWRALGKRVALWYAHGHVPKTLLLAEKFAHVIFTSTNSGFRLPSKKIRVVGQGIDTGFFCPKEGKSEEGFRIVVVGRISPVKNYETLILAAEKLQHEIEGLSVEIVGGAGLPEQEKYLDQLKKLVTEKKLEGVVRFAGPLANNDIVSRLQRADLFVNTSFTGSLDKAILEAMSCGVPVLTCNEALVEVLGPYTNQLMFEKKDVDGLEEKIRSLEAIGYIERKKLGQNLRNIVVNNHGLSSFVSRINYLL